MVCSFPTCSKCAVVDRPRCVLLLLLLCSLFGGCKEHKLAGDIQAVQREMELVLHVELPANVTLGYVEYSLSVAALEGTLREGRMDVGWAAALTKSLRHLPGTGSYRIELHADSLDAKHRCAGEVEVEVADWRTETTVPMHCSPATGVGQDARAGEERGRDGGLAGGAPGQVEVDAGQAMAAAEPSRDGAARDPVCGNGILEEGEVCDDGTGSNGDVCKDDIAAAGDCTFNVCGDGVVLEGAEGCDDGNRTNQDACKDNPAEGGDCSPNLCGDGVINPDQEECDDGPDNGARRGSPCRADCTLRTP